MEDPLNVMAAPATPGAPSEMVTKDEANYRRSDGSSACADCASFLGPDKCDVVRGEVAPAGLCDYYQNAGEARRMMFGGGSGGGGGGMPPMMPPAMMGGGVG